ncbi:hypothetical protein ACHQM5_011203 [Ranunculus cassubicifolius]
MNETTLSSQTHDFFLLYVLLLPIIFLIFRKIKHSTSKDPPLPPGPTPWPIIGNIHNVGTKPHRSLAKLAQIHGPLISLRVGSQMMIVASSPAAAKEILKTNDRILSARHVSHSIHAKSPELNALSVVWASECTEKWKYLRTICRTEIFSSKVMESQAHLREEKVKELIEFMEANEGKQVKIVELAFTTIINVISGICFSKDFININDEGEVGGRKDHIRKMLEVGGLPNLADYFPILSGFDIQGLHRKFLDYVTTLFVSWDILIKERRERGFASTPNDLLDVLLASGFTDDGINHLVFDLFVAGSDTTSGTVEWLMTELIKDQELMNNVREELAREVKTEFVRDADLSRLTYLNACVKETLRLHPPAPIVPHRALEECQVMNYTIPKDSQVLVNVWAVGRDSEAWEDPLVFKPSRFVDSNVDFRGNDFELVPFSAGRRMCPGIPLAAKLIPLIIASLVHSFDWDLPNNLHTMDLDMKEKFGITLLKEQPLMLIPKRRNIM